jgi:hypothetical protein
MPNYMVQIVVVGGTNVSTNWDKTKDYADVCPPYYVFGESEMKF